MKTASTPAIAAAALVLLAAAGCAREGDIAQRQTNFPGMVSAGGGTSGQVMAANGGPKTDATYAGGTPGIAGGSGGNTSGAATGGTVTETGKGPSAGVSDPGAASAPGGGPMQQPSGEYTPPPGAPRDAPATGAVHRDPANGAAPGR